jgi:SNF2 family DNA or RNA helicase
VRVAGLDRVPARAAFRRPIDPPPWRAEMSTAVLDGKPWFAIATLWGRVPAPLVAAEGLKRDGNLCLVPMQGAQRELIRRLLVEQPQLRVATKTLRCLELLDGVDVNETPPPALLTVDEESETFAVDVVWDDRLSERAAELPEARGGAASVSVVADAATAPTVAAFAREQGLAVDAAAAQLLTELEGEHGAGEELVKLSAATDADLDALRIRGELMPFQRAGVAYALRQRRTFIADEQGLGKTIQALAAIEAASAYPAVIVCPASLKLNWLRETNRWLPHRRATLLKGRRATELEAADVTIVNYDIVDAHIDALAAQEPGALVFDESHYCKNAKAKRTKALMALAERLPADALRLALTGTPLVNRPRELVPQLRILGRLDEFASGTSLERRFRGPEARARLHWHLRRRCYVRRRKADVLPQLPAKRRITVPMPLVNDREYRRLERNLLDWLHTQIRDPALLQRRVDSALRAQALVKLNALRHVAARGKLAAAIEWIDAYVASGERLVVFAHHRDIHRAVLDAFPTAARILGEDDVAERDAEVQRFQAGGPPLCVCSLEAASHGFTLTAAATVAFLELGWTPAKHDQAEDRLHRIGQQQRVTAYYLLAADTIDERIAALIDHKRAVVGSITDGSIASEEAIVDRLLRELATSPSPAVAAAA